VGSLKRIEHVAEIVAARAREHKVVVVVSAMSGDTDHLIEQARHFSSRPDPRELDVLLTTGEQKTVALLSICLKARQIPAISLLGSQVKIETDDFHTAARINDIDQKRIHQEFERGNIVIVPGFQGVTKSGELTTLGRGGSDTSAVALAAALKADVCDIYTDVEGVYTTDPNVEPKASKISKITFDEMLELASLGAKVLQTRSVEFAKKYKVPIHVRSTFKDVPGTWVVEELTEMESLVVSGVTYTKNEAKVVVAGMLDRPGLAAELFTVLGDGGVIVDVIVQNVSHEGRTDISFTCVRDDLPRVKEILAPVKNSLQFREILGDPHISKVSVIGNGMRSNYGVAARMFKALSTAGINIQMISTSEIKISCVIDESRAKDAVQVLHAAFELDKLAG